jgi:hypothetical protein
MYAKYIFGFVSIYIFLVFVVFCCHSAIKISDNAIVGLLVSTSINIIGLLAAVVRYLFPRRDAHSHYPPVQK